MADWRDIEDETEKYAAYLASREWNVIREAVRERSGGICERCKIHPQTATHHLTYKRKYNEKLEDLQAICQGCHDFTHAKSSVDPAAIPAVATYADARQLLNEVREHGALLGIIQRNDDYELDAFGAELPPALRARLVKNYTPMYALLHAIEFMGENALFHLSTDKYLRGCVGLLVRIMDAESDSK